MRWRWETVAEWLADTDPQRGAEIGVKEGRFCAHLLGRFPSLVMLAVDPWEDQPGAAEDYIGWRWGEIYRQYRTAVQPFAERVLEYRCYSLEAAKQVTDGSLDFVFIDAQHDYDSVRADIAAWRGKVRAGGLLCGHDYVPKFPGVIRAVDEAVGRPITGPNDCWGVWL